MTSDHTPDRGNATTSRRVAEPVGHESSFTLDRVSDDIIDQIDQALSCQTCSGSLEGSPSIDFCNDDCQAAWHAARAKPLARYREPVELAAHVANQVELPAPEVTPAHDGVGLFQTLVSTDPESVELRVSPDLRRWNEVLRHYRRRWIAGIDTAVIVRPGPDGPSLIPATDEGVMLVDHNDRTIWTYNGDTGTWERLGELDERDAAIAAEMQGD